jgi:hypothetical protein
MQYLTNHSNSSSGTLEIIRVESRKYWYRGLKQAELIIREKKAALSSNRRARERMLRDIQLIEESLIYLRPISKILRPIPILGTWLFNRVCDQDDKIVDCKNSMIENESLFRDCQTELEVATLEYNRMLKEHPEATELSFQELEALHGSIALLAQKASFVSHRMFAIETGLPIEAAIALLEADPEEREYLWERIAKVRNEIGVGEAAAFMGAVSPDQLLVEEGAVE